MPNATINTLIVNCNTRLVFSLKRSAKKSFINVLLPGKNILVIPISMINNHIVSGIVMRSSLKIVYTPNNIQAILIISLSNRLIF